MIDPTIDFPFQLADYLAECKAAGMTFDEAWTVELDHAARAAGFSWKQQPFAVEASLQFAKRHLRCAYEGREPLRYCVDPGCGYLALEDDGFCVLHATAREDAA